MSRFAVTKEQLAELVGLQSELFQAVAAGRIDPEDALMRVRRMVGGHVIDCDAPIPGRLMVGFDRLEKDQVGSRVRGSVAVDPEAPFRAALVGGQERGEMVRGKKVLEELRRRNAPVYGIAALEQMLQKGLIPDSLKGQAIFAWGDVLRDGDGGLYVRYLYWDGGEWNWRYFWIGLGWSSFSPAAVRASSA